MWTLPYSTPQKAGVILFGLLVGVLMVPITALVCVLLGVIVVFCRSRQGCLGRFFCRSLPVVRFLSRNPSRSRRLLESVSFSTARAKG
jgi:hypothetical protein